MVAKSDRDVGITRVLRRYPLPPAEQTRARRVLERAIEDGRAGDDVERDLVAWFERHPEVRLTLEREQARVAFAGEALALGAIYDGAHDAWTAPAGQSWDALVVAVAERLEVSPDDLRQLQVVSPTTPS